jgi:hypothetical protein
MGTEDIRGALLLAGLRAKDVRLRYQGAAQIIEVSGWHADGTALEDGLKHATNQG